jgi:dihydrofolate synthase/folylpolyglutamate synthase
MRFEHLNDWLAWQESLNPAEIDLGLDRISRVLSLAGLSSSFNCPLIAVAGTNGKGSVVAMLEAITMAAGLKVCSYTSPHLFQYNERIKINGRGISDSALCEAFERIDQARGECSLTYFEFGTLAAIDVFFKENPDLVVLEVGLGGRLDAVNIMDADVSVLTSVAIDHVDWLGNDRESIGYEKAGIFRAGKPVICGERDTPVSVLKQSEKLQCEFIQAGRDYDVINNITNNETRNRRWTLQSSYGNITDLPQPALLGEFQKLNAATAILALQVLQAKGLLLLPSDQQPGQEQINPLIPAISTALTEVRLPGRFQQINTKPQVYVDVAHNLQAAQALTALLKSSRLATSQNTWAIVAMLSDKDITGVLNSLSGDIDFWCFCGLEKVTRGASVLDIVKNIPASILAQTDTVVDFELTHDLQDKLMVNQCTMLNDTVLLAKTVENACTQVLSKVNEDDRIIIFGSFYTVAEAMQFFSRLNNDAVELRN